MYFCSPCLQSYRDNPKINAIVLVKGGLEDWPKLPPVPVEPEEDDLTEEHKVVLSSHSVCTYPQTVFSSSRSSRVLQ